MAAFFQNLFKKRSQTASRQDSGTPRDHGQAKSVRNEAPEATRGPEQSAIDAQRKTLADPATTQASLAELATAGLAADIRLEAVRKLTDEPLLQQVQRASRGRDKGVYQHARQALQQLRQEQEALQSTQRALEQLARDAEALAETSDTNLYEARTQQLEKQWQTLESAASNDQKTRILTGLHNCRQRVQQLAEERQEEQRHRTQGAQREETLALLQESLDSLTAEALTPAALPSLDALQRTQENRWLEATRDTDVSRQQQKQYETLMLSLRNAVNALRRLAHHQAEIEALLEQDIDDHEQATALLGRLEWPEKLARPDSVQQLTRRARLRAPAPQPETTADPEAQEKAAEKLDEALARLEAALAANQLKESRHSLKQAQGLQRQLAGKSASRYRGRLQRLAGQVRELGDWQGFATEPKQVALCEQMEHLAEQPIDPETKAARIQELQQAWRDLGGSSNRDLWQRFRTASDAAFEPCRAYFEARSDLKKVHLHKRHSICQELSRYLEVTDWHQVDWKAADQIEKTARKEWREAWPVDFRDNRPVQKEFDQLINTLSSRLDEERQRNEARKQEIVQRAQALVDTSPLSDAMDEAKALQKQWQDVGITRHREDRKLWKAFRAACDQVFARRDEQRQRRQQEISASDQAARGILSRAEALMGDGNTDEHHANTLVDELEAAANTPVSAGTGKELRRVANELRGLLIQRRHLASMRQWQQWIAQRVDGELSVDELPQHWQELQSETPVSDPRQLVVLGEILSGQPSPEEDQSLRMELQVRRLKEGFEGGQDAKGNTLEAIVARWCLSLPRESLTLPLAKRLQRALEAPDPV